MVATTSEEVRKRFGKRFDAAARRLPDAPQGRGLNAWLARELKHNGIKASAEIVRRYRTGESMPQPAKMPAVAKVLRVSAAYLRGDSPDPGTLFAQLEAVWNALPSDTLRAEVLGFARGKLPSTSDPPAIGAVHGT